MPWLADSCSRAGLAQEVGAAQAEQVTFGFEPGDIVSEVMSFGSPTPIEIVVASPTWPTSARTPSKIAPR